MNEELFDAEEFIFDFCPECSEENTPIGILGKKIHYNCRYCGLWWSEDAA